MSKIQHIESDQPKHGDFEVQIDDSKENLSSPPRRSFSLDDRKKPEKQFELSSKISYNIDVDEAYKHQLSSKLQGPIDQDKKRNQEYELCKCCGSIIYDNPIPMFSQLNNFFHLGPGIPLYLDFTFHVLIMILIQFLVVDLFSAISFSQGKTCVEVVEDLSQCPLNILTKYSILNITSNVEEFRHEIQQILQSLSALIIMVYLQYMIYKHQLLENEIDLNNDTPADYAIRVKNIPINDNLLNCQKRIREMFEDLQFNVHKVIVVYDIKDIIPILRKVQTLRKAILSKNFGCFQSLESSQKELQAQEKMLEDIINQQNNSIKTSGNAFVIFDTQNEADLLQLKSQQNWIEFLTQNSDCKKTEQNSDDENIPLRFDNIPNNIFYDQNHKIKIEKAPEPSDIFWENLSANWQNRLPNQIITFIIGTIIFLTTTFICYKLNQDKFENRDPSQEVSIFDIKSKIIPFVIVSLNVVARKALETLLSFSMPETYTEYLIENTNWQIAIKFMNSILMILMLAINSEYQLSKDDIISSMFLVISANSYGSAIIYMFFDPDYYKYLFRKFVAGKLSEQTRITQQKFNFMLELPELNFPDRYSNIFVIFIVCFFFSPPAPWVTLYSFIGLLLIHIGDRYIIVNRLSLQKDIGSKLSLKTSENLSIAILCFTIGDRIWDTVFVSAQETQFASTLSEITLILAIIYYLIPSRWIIKKIATSQKQLKGTETKYRDIQEHFQTDYDKADPTHVITKVQNVKSITEAERMLSNLINYSEKYNLVEVISQGRTKGLTQHKKLQKVASKLKVLHFLKSASLKNNNRSSNNLAEISSSQSLNKHLSQ